jgi:hypothetical protein
MALLAAFVAAGCGGDTGGKVYIRPWMPQADLIVGSSRAVTVELSAAVKEKTWVDIENQYTEFVKVDPADYLTYKVDEQKHDVTIKGLKASPGEIAIKFTVRVATGQTDQSRELKLRIVNQGIVDSGPMPDRGPQPDKPPPAPDKTQPADQAAKPDK